MRSLFLLIFVIFYYSPFFFEQSGYRSEKIGDETIEISKLAREREKELEKIQAEKIKNKSIKILRIYETQFKFGKKENKEILWNEVLYNQDGYIVKNKIYYDETNYDCNEYEYDSLLNVIKYIVTSNRAYTRNRYYIYVYNPYNLITEETEYDNSTNTIESLVRYLYDNDNNLHEVIKYDNNGKIIFDEFFYDSKK